MYKVLFAEDELLVRMGLGNSIPWEKYEMELTALAENGIEAYELFQKIHPDILITDLRMEGMDGVELVKKVRQIDKECAIVVISCLDDFEILRKLIPYDINSYLLKASISIEEIGNALEQVQRYLKKIGRTASNTENKQEKMEIRIAKYLMHETENCQWDMQDIVDHLLIFSLKPEDEEKINVLAMDFIYELVNRHMSEAVLIPLKEKEFCLFLQGNIDENIAKSMEVRMKRINNSIEDFLGIRFQITYIRRKENESLREWFDRTYTVKDEGNLEEHNGEILIQKSIEYMKKHHQEGLSLSDISEVIGLSKSYFSYLFKQRTGKNYIEYLNEIRLEESMKDLKNTDEKIVVIAEKHGFQNLEYFSRYFKKKTGESPAKWRKLNQ